MLPSIWWPMKIPMAIGVQYSPHDVECQIVAGCLTLLMVWPQLVQQHLLAKELLYYLAQWLQTISLGFESTCIVLLSYNWQLELNSTIIDLIISLAKVNSSKIIPAT